jgi:hypothetical protein
VTGRLKRLAARWPVTLIYLCVVTTADLILQLTARL